MAESSTNPAGIRTAAVPSIRLPEPRPVAEQTPFQVALGRFMEAKIAGLTAEQLDGLACAACGRGWKYTGTMLPFHYNNRTLFVCEDFAACRAHMPVTP